MHALRFNGQITLLAPTYGRDAAGLKSHLIAEAQIRNVTTATALQQSTVTWLAKSGAGTFALDHPTMTHRQLGHAVKNIPGVTRPSVLAWLV